MALGNRVPPWTIGMPLPPSVAPGLVDGIMSISHMDRSQFQDDMLVARLARRIEKEMGWDHIWYRRCNRGFHPYERALVAVRARQAVGLLITDWQHEDVRLWRIGDKQSTGLAPRRPEGYHIVGVIFVCIAARRQGIGTRLIHHLAADAGVDPCDLAWATPFSAEGRALACHFARPDGILWLA